MALALLLGRRGSGKGVREGSHRRRQLQASGYCRSPRSIGGPLAANQMPAEEPATLPTVPLPPWTTGFRSKQGCKNFGIHGVRSFPAWLYLR